MTVLTRSQRKYLRAKVALIELSIAIIQSQGRTIGDLYQEIQLLHDLDAIKEELGETVPYDFTRRETFDRSRS